MTQELQELFRGDQRAADGGSNPGAPGMAHLNAYLQGQQGGFAAQPAAAAAAGAAGGGGGGGLVENNTSLQNIQITSGDLGDNNNADMDNLSSNLDSSLKIGNPGAVGGGGGAAGFARQSSQLHTPDVSMSVEDAASKRGNNPNR